MTDATAELAVDPAQLKATLQKQVDDKLFTLATAKKVYREKTGKRW